MSQNNPPRRNFIASLLIFLWNMISWTRSFVFNFIFLLFIIIIIASIFSKEDKKQPDQAPLVIAPSGLLVDQLTYTSPQSQLLSGGSGKAQETVVRDLIKVIEFAGNDNRITGLILKLDSLRGGGLSKMQEIGQAIDKFKNSGKPVVAISDSYSQSQYFLASYADEIHMNDLGHIGIMGFGVYRNYYKEALDKVAVKFHVFKVGEFKDFVEPYIRNSMSESSRKHNSQWLHELWQTYTDQVEKRRDLVSGRLTDFVNHMADQLAKTEGDSAQMAFEMNLVDHIGSRIERKKSLIEKFGHDDDDENQLRQVNYSVYSRQVLKDSSLSTPNIALIVARGTILDGQQPEGSIGGDSLSKLIRDARDDENIKALVLRIDSGGGSAFASEVIRQELQATRDSGIPVVVSMGSVAASGGYWIAMAADEVWSTPSTITGSIGVFGLFPTIEQTLNKIGIHSDGVGTTNLAGALSIDRPLSPEAGNILQQGVESIYSRFISLVATSRKSTPEDIHKIAQGRVWTGAKAQELGLVDNLGYLDDAILSAATKADIQDIEVKLFERELSPKEQFIKELLKETKVAAVVQNSLSDWTGFDTRTLQALSGILKEHKVISQSTPRSTYALCMDCYAP